MAAVPKKTISPLATFSLLVDLFLDQGALQAGQAVHDQHAVEVIDFVLQHPGLQAVEFGAQVAAVEQDALQQNAGVALDGQRIAGNRQAAFLADLIAFGFDDLRD